MPESLSFTAKHLLNKHQTHLKKSLGQNLMIDKNIIHKILNSANIDQSDIVIEIGTGTGILTKELANRAKQVITFEIDKNMADAAKDYLKDCSNVEIIASDFLKYDFAEIFNAYALNNRPLKIAANLPYYITSPIIEKIILENEKYSNKLFSNAILTVQKEFAQRIVAKAACKDYGSFTLFITYYCRPHLVSYVSKSSFLPPPNVDSAIINLELLDIKNISVKDGKLFFAIIRAAFGQRRKTLRNALIAKFSCDEIDKALAGSKIDPVRRGETLSIAEFAQLADNFYVINK